MADVLIAIQGVDNLSPAAASAEASLGRLESKAGLTSAAFGVIGAAAATAGAAVAAGLAVGIKAAGDLQQSVANISTIKPEIDATGVFSALSEMSTRIPQAASQLGDSLYNVFSSMDVGQEAALKLTETFAKGAVGAQTSTETFGTAVMGVMNAYKLSTEDAAAVSDMFFDTVNKGVVTGQELAASLGPVTQAAKAAGVEWKDLGPMIAAATKEGGPAAQNINNLSNLFQKFTTNSAQLAMNKMGVATIDAAGQFRKVPEVLTDLRAHLATLTEAEQAAALQEIFPDAQARQGAQTLISQMGFVNDALATNQAASGSTAAAYATMSATFNSQVALMKNTGLAVLTEVGGMILPAVTPWVTAFTQTIPVAFQVTKDSITTIGQVLAGEWASDESIHPFTNAVGLLAVTFRDDLLPAIMPVVSFITGSLIPAAKAIAAPLGAGTAAFLGVVGAAGLVSAAVGAVTVVLGLLLSPLGLVALAAGALAAAWTVNFGDIQGKTMALVGIVQQALTGDIKGALDQFVALVGTTATEIGTQLLLWGQAFVAWVAPMIPPFLAAVADIGLQLFTWIAAQIPPLVAQLALWGAELWAWVAPQIPPLLAALGTLAVGLLGWIGEQIPPLLAQLLLWGQEFVAWVAPQIDPMITALIGLGAALIDWLTAQVPIIVPKLVEWGILFGAWVITTAIPELIKGLAALGTKIQDWIREAQAALVPKMGALGVALITGVYDGFVAAWATLGPKIMEAIAGAFKIPEIKMPSWLGGGGGGGGAQTFSYGGGGGSNEEKLGRAASIAQSMGFTDTQIRAMQGTLLVEGGLQGAVGDSGKSHGPFQLYEGGQFQGFVRWLQQNGIQGDPRALANDIDISTRYALGNYYGAALRSGPQGSAADLATYAQTHAQVSINPWKAGQAAPAQVIGAPAPPMAGSEFGMNRVPLSNAPGASPDQWPHFMADTFEMLPEYLQSLETIQQTGSQTFGAVAQAGVVAGAALVSASTDSMGNVTRIFTENGVAIGATITDASGVIVNAWGTMAATVPAQTETMAAGALTSVTNLGTGILTSVQTTAGTTIATVTDLAGQVTSQVAQMSNGAVLQANGMQAGVLTSATQMHDGMITSVQDLAGNAVVTVTDLAGNVTNQFVTMSETSGAAVSEFAALSLEQFGAVAESALLPIDPIEQLGDALVEIPQADMQDTVRQFGQAAEAAKKAQKAIKELADATEDLPGSFGGSKGGKSGLGKKAAGGRLSAGIPVIVGDGGRSELFVPGDDGYLYPSVPRAAIVSGGGYGGGGGDEARLALLIGAEVARQLQAHPPEVYLDGQRVTQIVRGQLIATGRRNGVSALDDGGS